MKKMPLMYMYLLTRTPILRKFIHRVID